MKPKTVTRQPQKDVTRNLQMFTLALPAPKSLLRVASTFLFGKQLLRKQLNPYNEEQNHEPKSSNDHR